jgi:hypothetical protein
MSVSVRRPRLSRWVLSLEMLMCFSWLTWMFGVLVAHAFQRATGTQPVDFYFLIMLSGTLIGPLGLVVAFRTIILERPATSGTMRLLLFIPAAWTLLLYAVAMLGPVIVGLPFPLQALGPFVLMALLPAIGAAHLAWIGRALRHAPSVA